MSSKYLIIVKDAMSLCFIKNVPAEIAKPGCVTEFLKENNFINPESSCPAEYWVIPLPEIEGDDEFDLSDYMEYYEFHYTKEGIPTVHISY